MSSAEREAETITVESSLEACKTRNSIVEDRVTQTESMMDGHSEFQPMSSMNASNNGFTNNTFTNTERIRSAQDNVMQASDASERSTTAGQSFILSDENIEVQSQETVTKASNSDSENGLRLLDISLITPLYRAPYQKDNSPFNSVNNSGGSSLSLPLFQVQPAKSAHG